jgi:hypothetical protein
LALFLALSFFLFFSGSKVEAAAACHGTDPGYEVACNVWTNESDCTTYGGATCFWGEAPTPTPVLQSGISTTSAILIDIASNSAIAQGLHNFFFEQIAFDIIVVGLILWLIIAHYVRST